MGPAVFDTAGASTWDRIPYGLAAGKVQTLRPGEVSCVTAGSGIVHSERTPPEARGVRRRFFWHSGLGCLSLQA
ncbi:pirin family protein [Mesorhizobium sp.]